MLLEIREPCSNAPQPEVWRLGDVLEELLGHYGLADAVNSSARRTDAMHANGGLFIGADLMTAAASAY